MARSTKILLALVAVAVLGYVAASPYLAVRAMRDAAMAGDAPGLAEHVDFPAVKESLKANLTAAVMKSAAESGEDDAAGAGAMFAMALMGPMVDAMVSPEGLAMMMRQGKLAQDQVSGEDLQKAKAEVAEELDADMSYRDFNTFVVTLKGRQDPKQPLGLIFKRDGIAAWKLSSLEMPM